MPFTSFDFGDPANNSPTLTYPTGAYFVAPASIPGTNPVPIPLGTVLAGGTAGVAYAGETFVAQGGNSPYTYSVLSGGLPSGLSFNSSTGVVSGTPVSAGTSTFTIQVTDSAGHTGTQVFTIVIASPSSGGGGGGSYTFVA